MLIPIEDITLLRKGHTSSAKASLVLIFLPNSLLSNLGASLGCECSNYNFGSLYLKLG